jgi:transposase
MPLKRGHCMKKSRYSEEQIVRILRETDRDNVAEVAKRNGVSEASIYGWQKRFGAMEANNVKLMKELQAGQVLRMLDIIHLHDHASL